MPSTSASVDGESQLYLSEPDVHFRKLPVFREIARMAMLYAEISSVIQSVKPPAYTRILELDEKARAIFASPEIVRVKPAVLPPPTMSV
jgi:hypothetical protein